ncbi:PepSY-associated TM helix domain-containing protein [Tellurirhabdus rosea]|uniref:PepSY-associated TM helix domain-containing protein n=1 Tax=Tellurirhabdus rosea TaxID=2674997 RepID=UPI002250509F|nr:PepSY-associated TM helix domain-containing protein [Tellurirhabdus rosea]
MKQILGKLHLWLGLASGLVVLIVSLTGCLYVFEEELRLFFYRNERIVTAESRPFLTPGQLAAAVNRQLPDARIESMTIEHRPDRAVLVHLKKDKVAGVNPYTGQVLGVQEEKTEFFHVVEQLHRNLLLGEVGKRIVGVSVLMYLFLLLSGLVLWWPRYKKAFKQKFSIKWNARWRRVNYDLHSVGGFYALIFLLVISMTGLVWAWQWWENSIFYLLDGKPRDRSKVFSTYQPGAASIPVDRAFAQIHRQFPGGEQSYVYFPTDSVSTIRVQVRYDKSAIYRKYNMLTFDQYTGAVLHEKRYDRFTKGELFRHTNYDLHTGQVLGLPGKILAFFASLFSASLPVSGFLVWWGRRQKACKTLESRSRPAGNRRKVRQSSGATL